MADEQAAPLHLIPDAPISGPGYDRLDRLSFVKSFAQAIQSVEGVDSVVLALAGPWGSGKSSLLNMVSVELRAAAGDWQPLIMRFNPWWFSGTDQLVSAFLQQLSAAVGRPDVADTLGDAMVPLHSLGETLSDPGSIDTTGDPASRDIELLREQLSEIFRNSKRRVLIFMDDIDRLTPDEMTQLLLIVRSVADFPNTTYVLAFDYEVVTQAIANKLGVDGRTYLEKVVLLQIDVPMPGRITLERMVVSQLEAIDPAVRTMDMEDQRQFRMLFDGGVKHFLTTPRGCTRLLNVLRFTYPTLSGRVYFPDLMGIACLLSFSSQAIQAIRSYTDAFVGHCDPSGKGWWEMRRYHQTWLAEIHESDRASVETIVRLLFPKVAWALNGPLRGEEYIDVWRKQRRICSVKHFDSYFRLGLTPSEAAEFRWQNIIEMIDNATSTTHLTSTDADDDHKSLAELLEQAADFAVEQASPEQALKLFEALVRRGDHIASISPEKEKQQLRFDNIHRVVAILVNCLLKLEGPDLRKQVLEKNAKEGGGLITMAELLEILEFRSDIFADGQTTPSIEATTAILMDVLRVLDRRIQSGCRSRELTNHPQYMKIIQKWVKFGRGTAAKAWIRKSSESDEFFVRSLAQVLPVANVTRETVVRDLKMPLELVIELYGQKQLKLKCETLLNDQPSWLHDNDVHTLETLKLLLEAAEA